MYTFKIEAPKNKLFYLILFILISLLTGYQILFYDYHMDDAWVIASNSVHDSIFTTQGFDVFLQNIAKGYREQWSQQGRFPGIIPIIRGIEGLIITNVKVHYFLNLLFNGLNAFFLYKILETILKVDRKVALLTALFFASCIAIDSSYYTIGLFIGSGYVNYLSLFLAVILLTHNYEGHKKLFWFLHAAYFTLAIGNYSFIVVIPSIVLFTFISTRKVKLAIYHFIFLLIPIILNLVIALFAPETTYIGTTAQLEFIHISHNLMQLFGKLLPTYWFVNFVIYLFIFVSIIYGCFHRKLALITLLPILGLLFGYLSIYSISARSSFTNPYFIYMPYAGMTLLLALCINVWKRKLIFGCFIFSIILWAQFIESHGYRDFRDKSAAEIAQFREVFKTIENVTSGPENKLTVLLFNDFNYSYLALGYFDKTINSWRAKGNKVSYIIATDYLSYGTQFKLYVGVNQYVEAYRSYLGVDEIIYRLNKRSEYNFRREDVNIVNITSNNAVTKILVEDLEKQNISYNNSYPYEKYGNNKKYYWTNGSFEFEVNGVSSSKGEIGILQFTITSLFNDTVVIDTGHQKTFLSLEKNKPTKACVSWPINELQKSINIKSSKSTRPIGDSRNLSFRIDGNAIYKVLNDNINIYMELSGFDHKGFYDSEVSHRWTKPLARINFDECFIHFDKLEVTLFGAFSNDNLPLATLNDNLVPTSFLKISNTELKYNFDNVGSSIKSLSFKVDGFKPGNGDPRELGFMFHGLTIKQQE